MSKINIDLAESIHENLTQNIRENYKRYYYLVYSYVKNHEIAENVLTNAIYFSLYNGRKLQSLPPMKTWFFQLIVKDGMRTMSKNEGERAFTKNSQLYAFMETLDPSATNVFKLFYFEQLDLNKVCEILHFNEYEAQRRLAYVRKELRIDSSMDEESLEKLEELVKIYEEPEIPLSLKGSMEDSINKEEINYAKYIKKYEKNKIIKPLGVLALAIFLFCITIILGKSNPVFAQSILSIPIINNLFQPFF